MHSLTSCNPCIVHSLADCYTTEVFSCEGNARAVADSGPECCNGGYLAYQTQGAEVCVVCSSKYSSAAIIFVV